MSFTIPALGPLGFLAHRFALSLKVIFGESARGVSSPTKHPWATLLRKFVRPRLSAPEELEDPRPPRFAQGVGLTVVGTGIALHLLGVPYALAIAAIAALVAALLNAAFGFCLGCQLYLILQRFGVVERTTPTTQNS